MGRMYAVSFDNVTVSAQVDFFEITPADDRPVLIHGLYLSQASDVGDAAEEMLRVQILRGHTTSGSGGSVPTPAPFQSSTNTAASFGCETNNTTIASAGTAAVLHSEAFNIRAGLQYIPTPEARPGASQVNTTLVVRLMAAPTDALSMSGTLVVEELG